MSTLTPGQRIFAQRLASRTGLNSRVISAWMLAEESGPAAARRQAQGNHNWLNIGYFDSGPGTITKSGEFHDPRAAADATAKFLEGKWGGASSGIRGILSARGASPREQIARIAGSGWATDPRYGRNIASIWGSGAPAPGADRAMGSVGGGATPTVSVAPGGDRDARRAALQQYVLSKRAQGDPQQRLLTLGNSLAAAAKAPAPANSSPRPHASSTPKPAGGGKPSDIFELFYDPVGGWKNGQSIGPIGEHGDHTHVAADPKRLIFIGRRAEKMGLHVGENSNFGNTPEPGVHAPNSYHYREDGTEAVDVGGPPDKLAAFTNWVRKVYNLK